MTPILGVRDLQMQVCTRVGVMSAWAQRPDPVMCGEPISDHLVDRFCAEETEVLMSRYLAGRLVVMIPTIVVLSLACSF